MRYFNSRRDWSDASAKEDRRIFEMVIDDKARMMSGSEAVLLDAAMQINGWGRPRPQDRKAYDLWEREHNVSACTINETALMVAAKARGE